MSIDAYEEKIIKWAEDRNLIEGSNPLAQLSKTLEECGEVLAALAARANYNPEKELHDIDQIIEWHEANEKELVDAYGDVLVTLIIGMTQSQITMQQCLEHAYNEIKDRKGKLVNGVFEKEE